MTGSPRRIQSLPRGLYGFIWRLGPRDQVLLSLLTSAVFLVNTVPLELQRRVVNDAIRNADLASVLWLAAAYGAVELLHGGLKYLMNVYRGWVNEKATLRLRETVHNIAARAAGAGDQGDDGVEVEVVVAETGDVGGFVGMGISEPLLQIGQLLSVFGYMLWLQPWIALMCAVLFLPQIAVVPPLQRMVNQRAAARIAVLRELSAAIVTRQDRNGGFAVRTARVFALNMTIYWLKYGLNFLMNSLYHLSVAGVLGVGGWMVLQGRIEVGAVVAFLTGLHRTKDPWGDLISFFQHWSVANVKYRLIADLEARFETPAKA